MYKFEVSKMKLTKLATKFTSKARERYNKTFDQSGSSGKFSTLSNADFDIDERMATGSSLTSTLTYPNSNNILRRDSNLEGETYSLERIRDEELNSVNSGNNDTPTSRYKKAYRSFKTAMKRNQSQQSSTLNASMFSSMNNRLSKNNQPLLFEDHSKYYDDAVSFDFNNNSLDTLNGKSSNSNKSAKNDLLLTNPGRSTLETIPDLIIFQNDYSYDDKK
jgi:hypothetical protein